MQDSATFTNKKRCKHKRHDLSYTNSFNCLLFEEGLHNCKYCTKYGRLINNVEAFDPHRKCILQTYIHNIIQSSHSTSLAAP